MNTDQRKGSMHGPGGMIRGGEKARDFRGTMKKLIAYLNVYKCSIIAAFIFAAISAVFSILGPKMLGKATTKIFAGIINKISGSGGGIDFEYIKNILLMLAVLYTVSALFSYIQCFIMSGVSMKVSYNMRKEISEKIDRMPLKYFDSTNHGEILSRVTNDVDTVSQTLNQSLTQIITSVTTVVGVIIMMFSISWIMAVAALCIIPLSFLFMIFIIRKSQKYFKEQQVYLGHVNGYVEEIFAGHIVMKAYNREEKSIKEFDKMNGILYKAAWKSQFLSGMMMPVMNFAGNLGYVAVCVLGSWLAIKKVIEVGDILAFVQYMRSFTQPITQIANISNVLQQTAASAERVFEFLNEDEAVSDTVNPVKIKNTRGSVEFKDINFGYNADKIVINGLSASVKEGEKVAIVGPTGAGKTTVVKLLMRFYDVKEGAILIDNNDIRDLKRSDLRSMFGMVLQDTWLYNGTIMENIRYGRLNAADADVVQAAKAAYADNFIRTLPKGYDMVINEDASNISQGQKQLLTIARAIIKDPKILILDEATSSVDTRTEVQIQKAMDNLMKNRTSFIIAHRLSTVRNADLILVVNKGNIVEQGTHNELIARNGLYADIYNSQFENGEIEA